MVLGKSVSCFYDHLRSEGIFFAPRGDTFAQTNRDGANSVKQRIHKLAKEQNWGDLTISTAVFPEDGKTSQALLSKAISELS